MYKEHNPLDMRDFLAKAKKRGFFTGKLGEMGKAVIDSTYPHKKK